LLVLVELNFNKLFFCENTSSLLAIEFRLNFLSIIERY